jgi:hypothetical protein
LVVHGFKRGQFKVSVNKDFCQIATISGFLPAKPAGFEPGITQFEKPIRGEGRNCTPQAIK